MLNSLRENDEDWETEINTANITESLETIELISRYEEIIKTQHKKVRGCICKQGEILKKLKKRKIYLIMQDKVDWKE